MKRKLTSGDAELKREPEIEVSDKKAQEDFEKAALAKLGGSVAFVRGRKLVEE